MSGAEMSIGLEPNCDGMDVEMFLALRAVHRRGGFVDLGLAASQCLAGIRLALAATVGPEAAYAALQREADAAALDVAMKARGPPAGAF